MKLSFATPIYTTIAVVIILGVAIFLPSGLFGTEWATVRTHLTEFLPWVVVFSAIISLFAGRTGTMKSDFPMLLTIIVCGTIGIVLAMLFRTMNASGILIDELISGSSVTISELMSVVILLWTMIGVLVGLSRK